MEACDTHVCHGVILLLSVPANLFRSGSVRCHYLLGKENELPTSKSLPLECQIYAQSRIDESIRAVCQCFMESSKMAVKNGGTLNFMTRVGYNPECSRFHAVRGGISTDQSGRYGSIGWSLTTSRTSMWTFGQQIHRLTAQRWIKSE